MVGESFKELSKILDKLDSPEKDNETYLDFLRWTKSFGVNLVELLGLIGSSFSILLYCSTKGLKTFRLFFSFFITQVQMNLKIKMVNSNTNNNNSNNNNYYDNSNNSKLR